MQPIFDAWLAKTCLTFNLNIFDQPKLGTQIFFAFDQPKLDAPHEKGCFSFDLISQSFWSAKNHTLIILFTSTGISLAFLKEEKTGMSYNKIRNYKAQTVKPMKKTKRAKNCIFWEKKSGGNLGYYPAYCPAVFHSYFLLWIWQIKRSKWA